MITIQTFKKIDEKMFVNFDQIFSCCSCHMMKNDIHVPVETLPKQLTPYHMYYIILPCS